MAKAGLRYLVPAMIVTIPILGFALWLLDGFRPLWDRRREALHDKLARSMVLAAR